MITILILLITFDIALYYHESINKNKTDYNFISPAEYETEEDSTQAEAETQEDSTQNETDEKPEERTPDEDNEKRARPEMPPPSEPNNQAILNI